MEEYEKNKDINKVIMLIISILAIIVKFVLAYGQYVTIYPPLAPIDDDLMFNAAKSIVNGNGIAICHK